MRQFDYAFEDIGLSLRGGPRFGSFSGSATVEVYGGGVLEIVEIELSGQVKGDANFKLDPCHNPFECQLALELDKALRIGLKIHPLIIAADRFNPAREYGTLNHRAL